MSDHILEQFLIQEIEENIRLTRRLEAEKKTLERSLAKLREKYPHTMAAPEDDVQF